VHVTDKPLLAARPDVRVVRRHFPLDDKCNPKLTRPFHLGACELARAGICAEAQGQGRFEAMDDALFANQKANRPLDRLVADLGLDAARFGECLRAPSTQRRLQADVAAGLAVGVRATPTWVVNGVAHTGKLPIELLPPPP
jgi:protein-disulfide isomerase